MGTRFSYTVGYEAPLAQVREMLGTVAFREAVCEHLHLLRSSVDIVHDGERMDVVIDQWQSSAGAPAYAQSFLGPEIAIEQREEWSGLDRATLDVTIPGKPGHLRGTIALSEQGGVTAQRVAGEVSVGLPLFGSRVEGMIDNLLRVVFRAQGEVGRQWLAGEL